MLYHIKEMNWREFDARRKETDTVLIPTGAVEVYGPHLPLGSDLIAANAICERVAQRTGALIAPTLDMGESSALLDFPGTFTLSKETFHRVVDEIFCELMRYGFKNFMFITGHASNVDSITYLCRKYKRERGISWGQVDWWRFTGPNGKGILELEGYMAHGHASECGTSVMLYLRPDLVDMAKATRVEPPKEYYTEYADFIRMIPFSDKTGNGTVGDATIATAEKGKAIVERAVERIVEFIGHEFGKTYR